MQMKEIEDDTKKMEGNIRSMDWKNLYCKNDHITQGNLQIQCNSYQNAKGIFHRARTNNFKFCMETQKILNSENNFERGKQSWRNHAP